MGMPATTSHWTVEMRNALPDDGQRYEVIDGELFVTPAPRWAHQEAVGRLHLLLAPYVAAQAVGHVILSPADVEFARDTVVEPDLFVVPLVDGRRPRDWREAGHMLLAIEVLSPTTARLDQGRKRALYQRQGVDEYWIVDVDGRVMQRWRPGDDRPEVLTERLTWAPPGAESALAIDLATFFADIAGE